MTQRQIELNGGAVQYLDMTGGGLQSLAHADEAKALAHREASEKLSEVITSWSERSVPAGTPNTRSLITGSVPRGTVAGELMDYFLQYKSFGLSFTAMQLEAIGEMAALRGGGQGRRSGLAYFAPLAVMLTLGGAVAMQIQSLLDFKKPEDVNPVNNPGFWLRATVKGGGWGLFGDFVKSSENRFGQSFIESQAGPGVAFIGDTLGLLLGTPLTALRNEKAQPGRKMVKYLGRYTPWVASHWATRGAFNRLVLDNLQWMLDPEVDKNFKSRVSQAKKSGTPYFIKPGDWTPARR